MNDIAISASNVSKCYQVFDSDRARLLHTIWPKRRAGLQEIWALRDIDLEIRRGESVAVIGRNGGGKSTLLEILTGTLTPTTGVVKVNGRISALLELGSGFNPEYTGRENVMLNGLLLGLTREEVLSRFDEILAFAEIGDAVDRPVKTYSSGMMMRLAFAVQVLTDPDILIIDEALSVGDFFFQQKCFSYIRSLCERGVTLLFVSHDMGTVRDLCSRALYLKGGHLIFAGATQKAIREYFADGAGGARADSGSSTETVASAEAGELQAILRDCIWAAPPPADSAPGRLLAVAVYDAQGVPATGFRLGGTANIKVAFRPAAEALTHVTVVIRNKFDQIISMLGSSRLGLTPPCDTLGGAVIFEMTLDLLLEAGNYSITVSLGQMTAPNRGSQVDTSPPLGPIVVAWDYEREEAPFLGMVGLPAVGEFRVAHEREAA
jgi:homopolymeric O-antigen transport system ATP-binding protein